MHSQAGHALGHLFLHLLMCSFRSSSSSSSTEEPGVLAISERDKTYCYNLKDEIYINSAMLINVQNINVQNVLKD
jgi:hypothetical protein